MKNKRFISLIMSLLFVVTTMAPVAVFADEAEGVKIVSTTPEDGSTGIIPMGATMEVTFNTPIDPATLSTATISSEPAAIADVVPNKTNPTKCTVYFSALELNTKYEVMFSKQIKSLSGDRLTKTVVEFKTTSQYPKHHQIVNGDMEDQTTLNMFYIGNAAKKSVAYVNEGENSVLKFDPQWASAPVGQDVYIEPGKTYEMRAKIKSTTAQKISIIMSYVTASDGSGGWHHRIVEKSLSPDTWVELSGSETIPEDLSYDYVRQVRITVPNKNEVIYIDDFQFFEAGCDVPMPKASKAEGKTIETLLSVEENGKIEQMVGLGIFDAEVLEKADEKVSRLDAAVYMGRIAGISETSTRETDFADLKDVKKRDSALAMVDMGVMKGYGKYFYPNNDISVKEVLEGMVNLLGYQPMAANLGYSNAVVKLKLNEGVKAKAGAVTYSDFATILANALDTDIMDDDSVVYGENLLWETLKVKEMQGIVTATEYTDIYGGSKAQPGHIIIDGVSYKVTFDTFGLEGKKVKFFTKEIEDENFILYMTGINTLNNILKIDWKDIEKYSSREYVYTNERNRSKKAALAPDKKLIYNGVALNDYTTDDMAVGYGSVELIDNNDDNAYDIVRIENIDTFVVKALNYDTYTIYDEYRTGEASILDLSSAENIIVEENGQKVQFGNIAVGTVVSVAKSKDGSFAKLYISKNKLESNVGKIYKERKQSHMSLYDSIHGDGASTTFTLHPFYEGTKNARENGKSFLCHNVEVAIDHMGYAVAVILDTADDTWKWGYLADAHHTTKAFDDKLEVMLFGEDGKFSILECAKKVNVNGAVVERGAVFSKINGDDSNNSVVPQLIRYRKNANDEIAQIISANDPEKRLTKVSGSKLTYFSALRSFSFKVSLSATSIPVFSVPSTIKTIDETQFVCSTASGYLSDNKEYTFDAYSIDDNELDAEFLVLKDRAVKVPTSWLVGMVMDIVQCIDEEGELYWKISAKNTASNYNAVVYPDKADITKITGKDTGTVQEIKPGDIIMYQNNAKNVQNIHILYSHNSHDTEKEPTLHITSNSKDHSANRVVYGTVTKRIGNLINLLPKAPEKEAGTPEVYDLSLYSRLLVYDSRTDEVYEGTSADVFDANCGTDSAEVVVVSSYGAATLMAVYK